MMRTKSAWLATLGAFVVMLGLSVNVYSQAAPPPRRLLLRPLSPLLPLLSPRRRRRPHPPPVWNSARKNRPNKKGMWRK